MTFFEYRGARRGRAGAGMVHRIVWRVESTDALDFWTSRFVDAKVRHERIDDTIRFSDGEGLDHELVIRTHDDPPLTAVHPDISAAHAIQGFEGVRAYSQAPALSEQLLLDLLGGRRLDDGRIELRGDARGGWVAFDEAPAGPGIQGAGTVHHVAFATRDGENDAWLERIEQAGIQTSGHVDRHYFKSIYFREPGGILYELATDGPGFTVDGPIERLGIDTILPPFLEPHRAEIEPRLTQLEDPRELWPDEAIARAAAVHATHPSNAGVGTAS
jgi:glyoxalase family protein